MRYLLLSILFISNLAYGFRIESLFEQPRKVHHRSSQQYAPSDQNFDSSKGNHKIRNFSEAKKILDSDPVFNQETIYCGCKLTDIRHIDFTACGYIPPKNSTRAGKVEREHVADASSFGMTFNEWRVGAPQCKGKKGRKCAETNPEFSRMEADLHNLWAEDGLTNLLRSNKPQEAVDVSIYSFGKCDIKLSKHGFQARPEVRGTIARTIKYMDDSYPGHGLISNKNQKLYDAWDKMYPATKLECDHHKAVMRHQGNPNKFTVLACQAAGLAYQ